MPSTTFINEMPVQKLMKTMVIEQVCNSCKGKTVNATGTVMFNCPVCKEKIIRCGHCRSIAAAYTCTCGFRGPV